MNLFINLLKAQHLWQAHYQIFSIIFLKEFIELNLNSDITIKKCETFRIKYNYWVSFLEYTNFKDDLIQYKFLCCNKNYKQKFDINLNEQFCNTHKLPNITISLFYCSEKVFILMNI